MDPASEPDPEVDPDPAIFFSDLQNVNKKVFFASYFLKVPFTSFFQDKKS
jgi:hypothetical protein